jgi:hypothetical protein
MSPQRLQTLTVIQIPNFNLRSFTGRSQRLTIRTTGHCPTTIHLSSERLDAFAGINIPQVYLLITPTTDQYRTVLIPTEGENTIAEALQRFPTLSSGWIP